MSKALTVVEYNGVTFRTIAEFAAHVGIPRQTVYQRIHDGWSIEKIATTPVNQRKRSAQRERVSFCVNGVTYRSVQELAKASAVSANTLRRWIRGGMDVEAAVTRLPRPAQSVDYGAAERTCNHCKLRQPVAEFTVASTPHTCRSCRRVRVAMRTYGPNGPDALSRFNGRCPICLTTDPRPAGWAIDHSHKTGAVRGILCKLCNMSLGGFGDDPATLERAAGYLRASAAQGSVRFGSGGPGPGSTEV